MPIWLKISPEVSSDLQEWLLRTSVLCVEDVIFRRSLAETQKHELGYTLYFSRQGSPFATSAALHTHLIGKLKSCR